MIGWQEKTMVSTGFLDRHLPSSSVVQIMRQRFFHKGGMSWTLPCRRDVPVRQFEFGEGDRG